MYLSLIPFQNHESNRITIFEGLMETKSADIKLGGFRHILHRQHCGNPPKANTMFTGIIHHRTLKLVSNGRAAGGAANYYFFCLINETVLSNVFSRGVWV
jgi:hypothetical protein